ncbi:MAG: DUF4249 family protein [Chryseolinea sp.]
MTRHVNTIWLIVVLILNGCVEPYNAPVVEVQPRIVVDALLTDQPGTQVVRLFYTSDVDVDLDKPEFISGATVSITDDTGDTESMTEVSKGIYQSSDDFAGIIGRQYMLSIMTETGEQLESDYIQMKSCRRDHCSVL